MSFKEVAQFLLVYKRIRRNSNRVLSAVMVNYAFEIEDMPVKLLFAALLLLLPLSVRAADAPVQKSASTGVGGMSCPPEFLTDVERRMYAKDNSIRSGPWHVRCFQNGTGIFDRDHLYVFCQKGDTTASVEGGNGSAIRFQFPPEIACVWER